MSDWSSDVCSSELSKQLVTQHEEQISRSTTPSPHNDSESSHLSKRACTATDRPTTAGEEQSPVVDDLLACAERVDGTPETTPSRPMEAGKRVGQGMRVAGQVELVMGGIIKE